MSLQLAQLFILHVFSKNGVLSHVTSDCGTKFIFYFFCSLGMALDMKLHFDLGYHPKGDGQTEWTNQTLEQYLQVYCNYQQDNWSELLPLAKFAYNNTPSATTSITPFFANKGYHPNITIHPKCDLALAHVQVFITNLDELHQQHQLHIAEAQHGRTLPVYVIYARGHMIRSAWICSESAASAELHIYMCSVDRLKKFINIFFIN